jgi:tetratricopeptide (TPR) repeat protein
MSDPGHDNIDAPEDHLQSLVPLMEKALRLRSEGNEEQAVAVLRDILRVEPRLAEPRLELCHIAAGEGRHDEAEAQARMAVEALRGGGQWTADLEADEILSFALNLLGEVIVRALEEGDLLMTDRPQFVSRWNEASQFFRESLERDNSNRDARSNVIHYRPMAEAQPSPGSESPGSSTDDSDTLSAESSPTTE